MNDDIIRMTPIERTIINFTNSLYHFPNMEYISKEAMRDLLSSGQLMSKAWLIDKFKDHVYLAGECEYGMKAIVCGGWVGFLAQLMNNAFKLLSTDSIDLDPNSTAIAKYVLLNGDALLGDMYELDYTPYGVILNTSAEHIPDVRKWSDGIPKGKLVVVQSNDARQIEEHISCVDSAEELAEKLNLSEVLYMGSMKFSMYTRFMIIGKK